jgi:hypothetical protein
VEHRKLGHTIRAAHTDTTTTTTTTTSRCRCPEQADVAPLLPSSNRRTTAETPQPREDKQWCRLRLPQHDDDDDDDDDVKKNNDDTMVVAKKDSRWIVSSFDGVVITLIESFLVFFHHSTLFFRILDTICGIQNEVMLFQNLKFRREVSFPLKYTMYTYHAPAFASHITRFIHRLVDVSHSKFLRDSVPLSHKKHFVAGTGHLKSSECLEATKDLLLLPVLL